MIPFIKIALTMAVSMAAPPPKQKVDLIVHHARIYTANATFDTAQAFAVKNGVFVEVGPDALIMRKYAANEVIDAGGKPVFPGFIDAHCHFYGFGKNKSEVNLLGSKSFREVVDRVVVYAKQNPEGWIVGRGWDQSLWPDGKFPEKDTLDKLFPKRPIYISRVDGHAALANQAALDLAGVNVQTRIPGGKLELKNGKLTGLLVDNAADSVQSKIPPQDAKGIAKSLETAESFSVRYGLTTVTDAGLDRRIVLAMDSLHNAGKLRIRIHAMLTDNEENLNHYLKSGPYITPRLSVRSFKVYGDGALGSRGACLLQPYSDAPNERGFLLRDTAYYRAMAIRLANSGFQMNTHCIGDSAVRFILKTYASVLKPGNDRRWRIEHAQVVNPADHIFFKNYRIIPSVQPTHATSDMRWAADRLGPVRVKHAYAYKDLIRSAGIIAGGSDFPVEDVNPLLGFYAAIARMDVSAKPDGGWQSDNAITRQEALLAMTRWAAFANMEEKQKGSIAPGLVADFVILNKDIMSIPVKEIPNVTVQSTWINGARVFQQ